MVFGKPFDQEMKRYSTYAEAKENHKAMVEKATVFKAGAKLWLSDYIGRVGIIIRENSKMARYPFAIKLLNGNIVYGSELCIQHSEPLSKLKKLVLGYYEI